MTRPRRWGRGVASLGLATLLLACVEPDVQPEPEPQGEPDPVEAEVLDPATDELLASLAELIDTVEAARDALTRAETADGPTRRAALDDALALLLADPDDPTDSGEGLLPARSSERERAGNESDQLSATISLARDAGGEFGRAAVETIREVIAGDLGAWERDAEGVVTTTRGAVEGLTDLEDATQAVLAIPGDGTRALAWTFLARSTTDATLAAAAAERGAGHLEVALLGLGRLQDGSAIGSGDADEADTDDTHDTDGVDVTGSAGQGA